MAAPSITCISPAVARKGFQVGIALDGSNFTENDVITLTKTGQPDIETIGFYYESDTRIHGAFDFTNAELGSWSVVVTNGNGSGTLPDSLTIINPPTITSITPNHGNNKEIISFTVTGTGFLAGDTVYLTPH